jgi:hypothetical protein
MKQKTDWRDVGSGLMHLALFLLFCVWLCWLFKHCVWFDWSR